MSAVDSVARAPGSWVKAVGGGARAQRRPRPFRLLRLGGRRAALPVLEEPPGFAPFVGLPPLGAAGAGRTGRAPGAGPEGAAGAAPVAAGAAGLSIRLMTTYCCPMLHRFVVSQYSSTPIGNFSPKTAKTRGRM